MATTAIISQAEVAFTSHTKAVVSWAEVEFASGTRAVVSWAEAEFGTTGVIQPPPTEQGGAGKRAGLWQGGPHAPAFRNITDVYRPHRFDPVPQPKPEQKAPEKPVELKSISALQPLFAGPTIGIVAPSLNEALQRQILEDDEEAIIAIFLALQ